MSTNNTPLKDVIKQEYVKCAKDPAYFMRKFCLIQHPIKGKIPFDRESKIGCVIIKDNDIEVKSD